MRNKNRKYFSTSLLQTSCKTFHVCLLYVSNKTDRLAESEYCKPVKLINKSEKFLIIAPESGKAEPKTPFFTSFFSYNKFYVFQIIQPLSRELAIFYCVMCLVFAIVDQFACQIREYNPVGSIVRLLNPDNVQISPTLINHEQILT